VADFTTRPDELLKEIERITAVLPEQAVRALQDAVGKYKPWRREALEDLLRVLEEDDEDEAARSWSDLCSTMRGDAAEFFEDALNNIQLSADGAAAGYRFQLTVMEHEGRFFDTLGKANAAQVRDYLCASRESLRRYTETLDQKWRALVEQGNKLQSEEKKLYDDMLSMTKRIVDEFTQAERTAAEQMRYAGQFPLLAIEKVGGMIADVAGLPDGVGEAAEKAAEYLREKNQQWLEGNRALQGRAANYRALVQAEKGGVLPLFKETRRQVYEYWDRNNLDRARDWMARFRSSLEGEWASACPTDGQREDARAFYKEALDRVERHFKALEDVAKQFEEKWNGVFKGALAPSTVDELVDTASWRVNAETLISIRTPEVINGLLDRLDGYYEESLEQPLHRLKETVDDLPAEARQQTADAVDRARARVEASVRTRIKQLQAEVGASLRWFEPDAIAKTLDRSELEGELD
jgi:hypothetical protein